VRGVTHLRRSSPFPIRQSRNPARRIRSLSARSHVTYRCATRRLRRCSADLAEGPREEVGRDGTLSAIARVSPSTGD